MPKTFALQLGFLFAIRGACADPTDLCVRITTSSGVSGCEGGGLAVIVNGVEVRSATGWTSGVQVHEGCYPAGSMVQVNNPVRTIHRDGWTGHVLLSNNGGATYEPAVCTAGCDVNGRSTAVMVVDGNTNPCTPDDGAISFCHNGATCTVGVPPPGWTAPPPRHSGYTDDNVPTRGVDNRYQGNVCHGRNDAVQDACSRHFQRRPRVPQVFTHTRLLAGDATVPANVGPDRPGWFVGPGGETTGPGVNSGYGVYGEQSVPGYGDEVPWSRFGDIFYGECIPPLEDDWPGYDAVLALSNNCDPALTAGWYTRIPNAYHTDGTCGYYAGPVRPRTVAPRPYWPRSQQECRDVPNGLCRVPDGSERFICMSSCQRAAYVLNTLIGTNFSCSRRIDFGHLWSPTCLEDAALINAHIGASFVCIGRDLPPPYNVFANGPMYDETIAGAQAGPLPGHAKLDSGGLRRFSIAEAQASPELCAIPPDYDEINGIASLNGQTLFSGRVQGGYPCVVFNNDQINAFIRNVSISRLQPSAPPAIHVCSGNGDYDGITGRCICVAFRHGPGCGSIYTSANTCNGDGVVDGSGDCTCNAGFTGSACQASSASHCSGEGTPTMVDRVPADPVTASNADSDEFTCTCNAGSFGDSCQFNTASYCNGNGVFSTAGDSPNPTESNGVCTCDPSSIGDRCYTDANTCNAQGTVDVDGVCSCATFYHGARCESQYTDAITCNEAGTVDANGACTCTSGVGVGCYTDAVTCNTHGTVSVNGACSCAAFYHGDRCELQYTDAVTCNAHGTVDVEGVCTCAASHSGDRCEVPVGGEEGGGEGAAEGTYDGAFVLLGSFDTALAYDGMAGTAELVIDASGIRTSLQVTAADADLASVTFKAHLHAAPCSADGGGHYQDPGNPGVVDAISEHWPESVCAAATGEEGGAESGEEGAVAVSCVGTATSSWKPTAAEMAAGLSIVIHDTPRATTGSGSKMMCADLEAVPSGPVQADGASSDSDGAPIGAILGGVIGAIAVVGVVMVLAKRKGGDDAGPRKNASNEAEAGKTDGFGFAGSSPGDDGYLEVNSIK